MEKIILSDFLQHYWTFLTTILLKEYCSFFTFFSKRKKQTLWCWLYLRKLTPSCTALIDANRSGAFLFLYRLYRNLDLKCLTIISGALDSFVSPFSEEHSGLLIVLKQPNVNGTLLMIYSVEVWCLHVQKFDFFCSLLFIFFPTFIFLLAPKPLNIKGNGHKILTVV